MIKSFWLHAAVLGLSAGLTVNGTASAQSTPAERPPASFSGDQYVDSRGCVFVRVGVGATTEWVPRVGRDRNQVCGQTPTGGGGVAAPDLAATSGVTVIGPAPGTPPAAAAPAATAPRVSPPIVVTAPPAAAPRAPAPAAPQVRVVTPAPAAPVTIQAPRGTTGCPNLPASAQPYFTGDNVRCGPQAVHPGVGPQSNLGGGNSGNSRGLLGGILGGGETTTIPRSFALSAPPAGYRLAWDDGRLNPLRGVGTPQGEAQMRQVWTDDVPMTLASVPTHTGQIVLTRRQRAAQALAERTQAEADARIARARLPIADQVTGSGGVAGAAPSNEVRVGSSHRHVLAGTFGSQGEASAAYGRLAATGLPARVGQINSQGTTLYVVMAGPYGDAQSLGRAVMQARNAGFSGAMTRN